MTKHTVKVIFAASITAIAIFLYIISFFYTGLTGFAVIGTSVQILDDSINSTPSGSAIYAGGGSGSNQNPTFFSSWCENRVVLQKDMSMAIDINKVPGFCVGLQSVLASNPYSFAAVQATNLNSIMQLDVITYPAKDAEDYFPNSATDTQISLADGATVFAKIATTQDSIYTNSNITLFQGLVPSTSDTMLLLSLSKNAVPASNSVNTTPPSLNDSITGIIENVTQSQQNANATNGSVSASGNTTNQYLMQQVQVIELDADDRVINKTTISLASLPDFVFNPGTKKIAIHWQNDSTPWLVFTRSATDLSQVAYAGENYTLKDYSKQFLLDTQNATIVPSQMLMFRTVLLGAISIGFLSLHNLALAKKFSHIIPGL